MGGLTRRRFLAAGTMAAGTAVVGLPPSSAAASPSKPRSGPAPLGDLRDIKHVMVVMQENRSFDHYFGALRGVRGFDDRSTITLPGGLSVFQQPMSAPGEPVTATQFPWHLTDSPATAYPEGNRPPDATAGVQGFGGTPHTWDDQHGAWQGGWMNGWVMAKRQPTTLGYLDRSDLPFHYALADAYTVGDAYHSSTMSATGPNRTYLFSGTIDAQKRFSGFTAYDGGDLRGKDLLWETYAETLLKAGVTWRVYQCINHYKNNALEYFRNFAMYDVTQRGTPTPGNAFYERGVATVPEPLSGLTANADNLIAAIRQDVLNATLPQVSWVVPSQLFSEHPDGAPSNGGYLIRGILNALNADPDVFNSTLIIVNYDENDGQFDHVPPPVAPKGERDEWYRERFGRGTLPLYGGPSSAVPVGLGFRVPLILVSPWTRGGWVTSEVSDHTSIIQFLERWTAALGRPAICPNISDWRRKVCGNLIRALDFSSPVYGLPDLPTTPVIANPAAGGYQPSPSTNAMPSQEPGTKPARPLPYQPNVNLDAITIRDGERLRARLSMSNNGPFATKAAHFAVYNDAELAPTFANYPKNAPTQHTISAAPRSANRTERVAIDLGAAQQPGAYRLTVVGPNRFLRRFTGNLLDGDATSEVRVDLYPYGLRYPAVLAFSLLNPSRHPVTFHISGNSYAPGSKGISLRVDPRDRLRHTIDPLGTTLGWYDVTVTVDSDQTWSRRYVGHLENGRASRTSG